MIFNLATILFQFYRTLNINFKVLSVIVLIESISSLWLHFELKHNIEVAVQLGAAMRNTTVLLDAEPGYILYFDHT